MGRWQPDARGRLAEAALELYAERGYDRTTVADIAARADLTERTFFRHFRDKREVLFDTGLQERMVEELSAAPATTPPLEAVGRAVGAGAVLLQERRDRARRRQAIIDATPELQERELAKLASMATDLAAGLRERGVADLAARLAAETGVAVFKVAFEQWIGADDDISFPDVLETAFVEQRSVSTA